MNDDTLKRGNAMNTGDYAPVNSDKERYKLIAMGGVPGILVGAGVLYAGSALAATPVDDLKDIDDEPVTLDVADGAVHPESAATTHAVDSAEASAQADSAAINVNITINTEKAEAVDKPVVEPVVEPEPVIMYSQVGHVEIYSEAPIAYGVNDSMSFSEAFAAARAEVGPGGVFHYRGGDYGTYYADEWQSMSKAERDLYADSVHPEVPADVIDVPADNPHDITINIEVNGAEVSTIVSDSIPEPKQEVALEETGGENLNVTIGDTQHVTMPDGQEVTVTEATIEGTDVAFIDLDSDGQPDIALADLNNDGELNPGEAINLNTGELIELEEDAAMDDSILTADADIDFNDDFINDADVSLA